jgi:predicted esterase
VDVLPDVDYGVGEALDVYRPAGATGRPTVLFWHGMGVAERAVLVHLGEALAGLGAVVFIPDWRSDAADGGRAHLLGSLDFVRERAAEFGGDPGHIVLGGWSLGAANAMSVAADPAPVDGWRPRAVVAVAGRYDRPTRALDVPVLARIAEGRTRPVPIFLVHGVRDEVVPVEHGRQLAEVGTGHGWPVELIELDADHVAVAWVDDDPEPGCSVPGKSEAARRSGGRTAAVLWRAAGGEPVSDDGD